MMKELRLDYPKCVLGRLLNVSASGYYAWVDRPSSRRAQEEVRLELEIRAAHKRTRQTYGPERLQRDLAEHGVRVGICRIKRIRKKLGIRCRQKRRFKALGRDGAADGRTAPAGLRHPPLRTGRATFTASGSPSDGLDRCVGNIGFSAILVGFIHPASGVVRFVPLPSDCPPSPCGRLSRPRTTTRALPHVRRWPKAGLLRCRRAGRASQVRPGCIFMPS